MNHFLYPSLKARLLVISCLVSCLTWAQPIAYTAPVVTHQDQYESVINVLNRLEQRLNISFDYDASMLQGKTIKVDQLENAPADVEAYLNKLFQHHQLRVKRFEDNTFVIYLARNVQPKKINKRHLNQEESASFESTPEKIRIPQTLPSTSAVAQTISGQVTDLSTNEPLPGVNILAKGTATGTVSDVEGNYRLTVADEVTTLVFSSIGYETVEEEINGRSAINISLSPDIQSLSEVVVVGYGTQQKRDLTGSVSKVDGSDLRNIPAARVDQTLQGRAPGVQVTQISGEPGAATSIRIRGGNSIQGNNEPLWVIDGVIVGQNFDLNNINTNDIESIDILKDAASVSIYGTRGANGVILVTTKSGAGAGAGTPQITLNAYTGVQSILGTADFLNGPQHAAYANEDAEFRSAALPFPDANDVADVDWVDQVTENAPVHNIALSMAGTSTDSKINYYLSGNYFNQEGIIRSSGIKKYIFRANLDYQVSDMVKTGFRFNVSRLKRENNKVNISQIFQSVVPARAIYDENGEFTNEDPVSTSIQRNPEADVQLKVDNSAITNFLGSLYLEVEPTDGLTFRTTFSPEINQVKRNRFNPGVLPENLVINDGGDARIDIRSDIGFINENTLSYSTSLGQGHALNVLGGFTLQQFNQDTVLSQSFLFSNDLTQFNNLGFGSDPTRNTVGSGYNAFQLVSWLGRANYTFQDKYLVTLVGRVDGSSRFAPGNRYAFFPSAAVGWRLSDEQFIKDLGVFDNLKLRASYGISGSQAIESFRTFAILDDANTTFNGVEQAGVVLGRPDNPDLQWETTQQLDIGLEASFLKGRLSFELDYYDKQTEDLLLNVQIPRQTGFVSRLQNLGRIQNRGIELMVNSVNVSTQNVRWSTLLTLSGNRNTVLDLGGVDLIDVVTPADQGGVNGRLIVGQPAPVFVGVNYLGTWKSQEEIDASGVAGQDVGGPNFEDTNGDGQVNEEDFIVLGHPQPDFIFGLQNDISYKNFSLDFFIQGTYGEEVFNSITQTTYFGRAETTKYAETLNRWTPENPISDIPRAGAIAALSEIKSNSEMVEDGSHLRLKTVRLSYNLPTDRWGWKTIKGVNVYFAGNNLFVLSNFRLVDPETSLFGQSGNDLARNVALGFSEGEYPSARTVSLGFNITL
ncbi:MAG: SusC/RagA family TonB-linked outer membrane protein [Cyclobacteriaceae bacterium]